VYLCGYTATPEEKNTQQTTMGTHKHVSWEWHQHTSDVLDALKAGTDGKVHIPIYTLLVLSSLLCISLSFLVLVLFLFCIFSLSFLVPLHLPFFFSYFLLF